MKSMLKRFFTKFLMQFEYLFIEILKKKKVRKKKNPKIRTNGRLFKRFITIL